MNKRILLYALLILVSCQIAFSISVTPGTTRVLFEPFAEEDISIIVSNRENQANDYYTFIGLHSSSELNDYSEEMFTLPVTNFSLDAGQRKQFKIHISFPYELPPGSHELSIPFFKVEDNQKSSMFGAKVVVSHMIVIEVPYPGKYIKPKFVFPPRLVKDGGESLNLYMYNLGKERIDQARGIIDIYFEDKRIETVYTDFYSLDTAQEITVPIQIDVSSMDLGNYMATGVVSYDGKTTEISNKSFKVGELFINVTKLSTHELITGGINKFNFFIQSMWNTKINGINAKVKLYDIDDKEILDFKTHDFSADSWRETPVTAFLDASNVPVGNYTVEIELKYDGESSTHSFPMEIKEGVLDEIDESEIPSTFNPWTIIAIAVVLLVIINIVVLLYLRKRNTL